MRAALVRHDGPRALQVDRSTGVLSTILGLVSAVSFRPSRAEGDGPGGPEHAGVGLENDVVLPPAK